MACLKRDFVKVVMSVAIAISTSQAMAAQSEFSEFYDYMKYLNQRDRVLSQNIANVDTPGYRPKDLKFDKSNTEVNDIAISRTNSSHFDMSSTGNKFEMMESQISEIKPNGNAVSLEEELRRKSENALRLQEATNTYNKMRSLMRQSITGQAGR